MRLNTALMGLTLLCATATAGAWGERGHEAITEAAVELLAEDSPEFLSTPAARARLVYLSVEPDRWRNTELSPMGHINKPDHYFDIELLSLYELTPQTLPAYRHDYIAAMAVYKAEHPEKDFGYNRARDRDHSGEWPGMAPYRICEVYVQLKSSWQTLNTYEKYADVVDEATLDSCRQNIIYLMGIMSHYVGDTAQPLHTTLHHHGWVGANPHGYTTERGFHSLIDTGALETMGVDHRMLLKLRPAKRVLDDRRLFAEVMQHVFDTHAEVETFYMLEKRGAFQPGSEHFDEGAEAIRRRLSAGAVMLNGLWESARRDAGIDEFRERILQRKARRKPPASAVPAAEPAGV